MKRLIVFLVACLPSLTLASGFDGKQGLLCAPEEAYECDEAENCLDVDEDDLGMADFLEVNFKARHIRAAGEEQDEYIDSPISVVLELESGLLLQGTENGMAWSLSISGETGRMVLAVAGLDHGFVVFGACTVK